MIVVKENLEIEIQNDVFEEAIEEVLFVFFSLPLKFNEMNERDKLEYLLKQINYCNKIELKEYEEYDRLIQRINKKIARIKESNEK